MKLRILLMGIALSFAFVACKSSFPDTKWVNKQWTLIELGGVPVQISNSPMDAHLIFNASDQMVNGNGACNRIFGPYEIGKKNMLEFGNLASTRATCANQAFEDRFLETLRAVRFYEVNDGELWLKNGKKNVILKLR